MMEIEWWDANGMCRVERASQGEKLTRACVKVRAKGGTIAKVVRVAGSD